MHTNACIKKGDLVLFSDTSNNRHIGLIVSFYKRYYYQANVKFAVVMYSGGKLIHLNSKVLQSPEQKLQL